MNVHARAHEFGPSRPRVRIWTDELAQYGRFETLDYQEAENLLHGLVKLGIANVIVHQVGCDGGDECHCPRLAADDELVNLL